MITRAQMQYLDVRFARIERRLRLILRALLKGTEMSQADIERLRNQVARSTSVQKSAVMLIQGLVQQIKDAADDPAELQELAGQLEAQATALAEAVTAGTPAEKLPV